MNELNNLHRVVAHHLNSYALLICVLTSSGSDGPIHTSRNLEQKKTYERIAPDLLKLSLSVEGTLVVANPITCMSHLRVAARETCYIHLSCSYICKKGP